MYSGHPSYTYQRTPPEYPSYTSQPTPPGPHSYYQTHHVQARSPYYADDPQYRDIALEEGRRAPNDGRPNHPSDFSPSPSYWLLNETNTRQQTNRSRIRPHPIHHAYNLPNVAFTPQEESRVTPPPSLDRDAYDPPHAARRPRPLDQKSVSFWLNNDEEAPPRNMSSTPTPSPFTSRLNARKEAKLRYENVAISLQRSLAETELEEAAETVELMKSAFSEFEATHHLLTEYLASSNTSHDVMMKESRYYDSEVKNYISLLNVANDKINDSRFHVQVGRTITTPNSTVSSNTSDIMKLVHSIKAPQVQLDHFDGSDSKKFHPFIKKFDLAMQGCDDYQYMVQMLLQCCTKDASRDLSGILYISNPKKALEEGRRILFEKYGDQSEISYDLVESLRSKKNCTTANDLKLFSSDLNSARRVLIELNMIDRMISDTVIRELVLKLPDYLCKTYQKRALKLKKATGFYPDFDFLCEFVQESSDLANDKVFGQNFLDVKNSQKPKPRLTVNLTETLDQNSSYSTVANVSAAGTSAEYVCPVCKNGAKHKLWNCMKFKQMKVHERIQVVRTEKLCHLCLLHGHYASNCSRTVPCKVEGCGLKHTAWIHGIQDSFPRNTSMSHVGKSTGPIVHNSSVTPIDSTILTNQGVNSELSANQSLADDPRDDNNSHDSDTASCGMTGNHGSKSPDLKVHLPILKAIAAGNYVILVGLDNFSSNTFCSRRFAEAANLKIRKKSSTLTVGTMNGISDYEESHVTDFMLESMDRSASVSLSHVFVWDKIPVKCDYLDVSQYEHLKDLDLFTGDVQEIDLLIGQDFAQCLMPLHTFRGENISDPYAVLTMLGTVLNSSTKRSSDMGRDKINAYVTCCNVAASSVIKPPSLEMIEKDISRLYDIENPTKLDKWSQDDIRVVELWENEMKRVGSKYQLPIPIRDADLPIPNNYVVVKAICESLVKRLKRKGNYEAYDKKMKSLIADGYVEIIDSDPYNNPNKTNYIPHHDVYHPRKSEPRIVHNAKFQFKGQSLNDRCLQGPNFLSRADTVLTRFRLHQFAIQSDIRAMYFQVIIPPEQRDMLRFLWFDDDGNLIHLRHCRHIFGGIWCSSSSQFVLRKSIEKETNPIIRNAVLDSFYVDDFLRSVDSISELEVLATELPATLNDHGYEMTKFLVNDAEVLSKIPLERRAEEIKNLTPNDPVHAWALGIRWEVNSDVFYFEFDDVDSKTTVTRRRNLSVVSGVYDPLMQIAPMIIFGRILFQQANKLKLSWDEPYPPPLVIQWDEWISCLQDVHNLKIPRCIKPCLTSDCTLELHTFADASLDAYCAVSYLRSINSSSGEVTCHMVRSKNRVAPIKQISIPRLELQACLMACQLAAMIRDDLHDITFESYYWSDSKIALAYIMNDSKKFSLFVANRLTDIHKLSATADWHFVSTEDNPADLGTRGRIMTHEELSGSLWFSGPSWLSEPKNQWPVSSGLSYDLSEEAEIIVHNSVLNESNSIVGRIFEHYSSFFAMQRAAAYLLRFIDYVAKKPVTGERLTMNELQNGKTLLIIHAQSESFSKEKTDLTKYKSVNRSSSIAKLSPFIDAHGILRVGGRTGANQILLQGSHQISNAIVQAFHFIAHTGVEWTLGLIRQEFWLTKGRAVVKSYIMNCVTCKRLYGKPQEQFMAPLPFERITPGLPIFSYVGIDIFGPYSIRNYRSNLKRYMCLFTCMTTRAVHLEVLFTLDTCSMISGLRRFIARRGQIVKAFSDQGTNLTGAFRELQASWSTISIDKLKSYALNKAGFEWEFISPKSPWKGGAWERLIGVSKRVAKGLKGILDQNTKMNDEVLSTLFCEVENIVNGRPLTKVNDDPNDFSFISPNHLLISKAGSKIPPGTFDTGDLYRKAWRHTQDLANRFWKVWVRSYLPELIGRQKWLDIKVNLAPGDLVLLHDDSCPRNLWPLAIVKEVKIGRDGLVRSIKLKTRTNDGLTRPIRQVILLEAKTPDCNPKTLHFKNVYK